MRHAAFLLLLALTPASAKEVRYAQHWRNELRSGPGAWYPAVGLLEKGAAVEVLAGKHGWSKVAVEGFKAGEIWAADTCLGEKPPSSGIVDWLRGKTTARKYVPATAAVRGFAVRYGRAKPGDVDAWVARQKPAFSASDYEAFLSAGRLQPVALADGDEAHKLPSLPVYDAPDAEVGVGLGLASAVAGRGLVDDKRAERYLNLLTAQLAAFSGSYAQPFRVFIAAGAQPNAVSVPGGWIFVTRPLLAACRNEAELAAVLAHEMTHITARHGLKEIKERSIANKAEEAQAELDEMGGGQDKDAAELDELADSAYDTIHKPRLQSYEEEADRGAMLLLARAGYDAGAVPRMIERVGAAVTADPKQEDDNPFSKMDYAKRRAAADAFLKEHPAAKAGALNAERFQRELPQGR